MKIKREILENLYINENRTQKEVADILGISPTTLFKALKEHEITKSKCKNHYKTWTDEENETLQKMYGTCKLKFIAKKLDREVSGIQTQAWKIKLGASRRASEYITACELAEVTGRNPGTIIRWIKNNGLKANKKATLKTFKYYRIRIEDFWNWSEKNQKLMRWDKYIRNSLGAEPIWLEDIIKNLEKNNTGKAWTTLEDLYLAEDYKNGMSLKDMSKKYARKAKTISKRITDLKVPRRRIRITYKQEEDKIILEMVRQGKSYAKIAEEIGREASGVVNRFHLLEKKGLTY